MKKRKLAFIMAFALILQMMPFSAGINTEQNQTIVKAADGEMDESENIEQPAAKKNSINTVGKLKYVIMDPSTVHGTAAVYGTVDKKAVSVKIPGKVTINGYSYRVTAIYPGAFMGMKKLKAVFFGANVIKIGGSAFENCTRLQFLLLPEKVRFIKADAFAGCTALRYLIIKTEQISYVGVGAFDKVNSKICIKTTAKKQGAYRKLFRNPGKLSSGASFVVEPVKIKYNGKIY